MRKRFYNYGFLAVIVLLVFDVFPGDFFTGTWCVSYLRLVITFKGKDSIYVSSMKQGKIRNTGKGTFVKNDSVFTAAVKNTNETELKMSYKYTVAGKSSVKAKVLYFIVDTDTAEHPDKWIRMDRCNPQSYKGWISQTPRDTARKGTE